MSGWGELVSYNKTDLGENDLMCSGAELFPFAAGTPWSKNTEGRGGPVAGSACAQVGKGGLTYTGRILLCFLFLTAFPRGVMVMAQLPVGENLGY